MEENDHYAILGLPTGLRGSQLSQQHIVRAYKSMALKLHPDKRLHDPFAHSNFQRLHNSYDVLKDKFTRQVYDDRLRVLHQTHLREKMMCELRNEELAEKKAREEEERRVRKRRELEEKKEKRKRRKIKAEMRMRRELEEERRRVEMVEYFKKKKQAEKEARDEIARFVKDGAQIGLDKGKVVKVSWDRIGEEEEEDYGVPMLRELFQVFGEVQYVLIRRSCEIKSGSAFIVMASKDAVVAATRSVVGYLDNPLLVLPILSRTKEFSRIEILLGKQEISKKYIDLMPY